MSTTTRDRNRETEGMLYYHEDGISDIVLGGFVIALAALLGSDLMFLSGGVALLLVLAWQATRRSLVLPRISTQTRPAMPTTERSRLILIAILVVGIVATAVALFLLIGLRADAMPLWLDRVLRQFSGLAFGAFLAATIALLAAILKLDRFYFYAGMLLLILALADLLAIALPLSLALAGCIMLLVGLVLLARFLRIHPRLD